MIPPFDYQSPRNLQEACGLLWTANGKAKVIAGGTDLVITLRNRNLKPQCLIDVTNIDELRGIRERNGMISIGAAVTHAEIECSPLVRKYGRILADAASVIGSPQIRNLGTIGGNIVNASPAADLIPPLMVLNSHLRIVSKVGLKEILISDLFQGPYETVLKPHELVCEIFFPCLPVSARSIFVRLARRGAMAIARISMAIILQIEGSPGRIRDIRICFGSVTPTFQRMFDVENFLKRKPIYGDHLRTASMKVSEAILHWSGMRPSSTYKLAVVESLFDRTIRKLLGEDI